MCQPPLRHSPRLFKSKATTTSKRTRRQAIYDAGRAVSGEGGTGGGGTAGARVEKKN